VTIHPPARLVGEQKKTKKRKEGRKTPKVAIRPDHPLVGTKSNFAWWVACGV